MIRQTLDAWTRSMKYVYFDCEEILQLSFENNIESFENPNRDYIVISTVNLVVMNKLFKNKQQP